jgi:hypothetical protein
LNSFNKCFTKYVVTDASSSRRRNDPRAVTATAIDDVTAINDDDAVAINDAALASSWFSACRHYWKWFGRWVCSTIATRSTVCSTGHSVNCSAYIRRTGATC